MPLFGIYGRHEVDACPLNHLENAKNMISMTSRDLSPMLSKYKINNIVGQYHSALEHTFVWIFDAEEPHLIQQFMIESGVSKFNEVRIIPMSEFQDVIKHIKNIHGL